MARLCFYILLTSLIQQITALSGNQGTARPLVGKEKGLRWRSGDGGHGNKAGKDGCGRSAGTAFPGGAETPSLLPSSYDSNGASKDEIKERFAQTMEFVEEYLRDVVCQRFPFSDKEKNKLTFEVAPGGDPVSRLLLLGRISLWAREEMLQMFATALGFCREKGSLRFVLK